MFIKIITCDDYEKASQLTAHKIIEAIKKKPNITLGLATGSTPLLVYQYLVKAYQNKEISFKNITTFNLDEYIDINPAHPQSYKAYMKKNLFDHVDINPKNTHIPTSYQKNPIKKAKKYNSILKKHPIDLQLLGLGSNGHIGFNEPGTSFKSETSVVKLFEETRRDNAHFFGALEEVPTHAITMGIANIMNAKEIILLVYGKSKALAVQGMIEGPIKEVLPASVLQQHENISIILDVDSSSKLTEAKR